MTQESKSTESKPAALQPVVWLAKPPTTAQRLSLLIKAMQAMSSYSWSGSEHAEDGEKIRRDAVADVIDSVWSLFDVRLTKEQAEAILAGTFDVETIDG